jgi:hypothetical protein
MEIKYYALLKIIKLIEPRNDIKQIGSFLARINKKGPSCLKGLLICVQLATS